MNASDYVASITEEIRVHVQDPMCKVKDVLWCRIYFTCRTHLLKLLNGIFCPGGRLHAHFVKRPDNDQWVHFKDSFWYKRPSELPLDDQDTMFTLTGENYLKVLRSNSHVLMKKRNFNFFYDVDSWRRTGFCCLCSMNYSDDECSKFVDADLNECVCGCSREHHYIDEEWDVVFEKEGITGYDIPFVKRDD